jgi:hypothetical protein
MDTDETRSYVPTRLEMLGEQVLIQLIKRRQPEAAVDLIHNADPTVYLPESVPVEVVRQVTGAEVREAIMANRFSNNRTIADGLGCHWKTVAIQRRLLQKSAEVRAAVEARNRRGAR